MPTIGQGGTLPVRSEVRDGAGALADVSALTLTIRDSGNSIVSGFPVTLLASQVIHDSTGRYHYDWVVDVAQPIDTYTAFWQGTLNDAPITGQETLYVVAPGSISPSSDTPMPFRYLTPRKFSSMKLGVDLSSKSNYELAEALELAAAIADSFCQVPSNHDFRGGMVVGEQHPWNTGNAHIPGQRRIYPDHFPIKSVDSIEINVTTEQRVTFPGSSLYINYVENWVEIVTLELSVASVFAAGILPNLGLIRPVSKIDYAYGWDYEVNDERLSYGVSATSGTEFQGLNQFWTLDPIVVKKNGTTLAETTDYTVDRVEGIVKLNGALSSTDLLTASYHHPLPLGIPRATALIAADLIAQEAIYGAGLGGLSSLRVEEVEMRVSRTTGFNSTPINPAAAKLLGRYRYRPYS